MTYNYYFDSDERDYSVKPPKMTEEEIDELNNNDENWFKYMMKKEPLNEKQYQTQIYNTNYIIESELIENENENENKNEEYISDCEDYELDDNQKEKI